MDSLLKIEITAFARIEGISHGEKEEKYSSFGIVIPESKLAVNNLTEKIQEHAFNVFSALALQLMDIDDGTDIKITLISENEYKINTDEEEYKEEE